MEDSIAWVCHPLFLPTPATLSQAVLLFLSTALLLSCHATEASVVLWTPPKVPLKHHHPQPKVIEHLL